MTYDELLHHDWPLLRVNEDWLTNQTQSQNQIYVTTDGRSASLSWCQALIWELRPDFFLSDNCGFVDVGSTLWREGLSIFYNIYEPESESHITTDGRSASLSWNEASDRGLRSDFLTARKLRVCWCGALSMTRGLVCRWNCCWPSPAQSFSGPSPVGLVTIFYCLRFDTSLFVASYDSQGYGGGIRTRLHTGWLTQSITCSPFILRGEPNTEHYLQHFPLLRVYPLLRKHMLISKQPIRCLANRVLSSRCLTMDYSDFQASWHNILDLPVFYIMLPELFVSINRDKNCRVCNA
jgi:hypothetical protein